MRLFATIGVAICLTLAQGADEKYCNEGRILWAQLRFYKKEIVNRVAKLESLVAEFSKCREYTEDWQKWPAETKEYTKDETATPGSLDDHGPSSNNQIDRRVMRYRYQSNDICKENFDADWTVGPSGVAFEKDTNNAQLQQRGVAVFDAYKDSEGGDLDLMRVPHTAANKALGLTFGGPQVDQCLFPHYDPATNVLEWQGGCIMCNDDSMPGCPNNGDGNTRNNDGDFCGFTPLGNCHYLKQSFDEPTYPPSLQRGSRRLVSQGQENLDQRNGGLASREAYTGTSNNHGWETRKRIQATGSLGNGWAWIGATRFCGAVNTLMNWISRQTNDIPEAEHFTKQEAWCNVLEEAIIHESLKTSEKKEMGVLLNDKCKEWTDYTGATCSDTTGDYDCEQLTADQFGLDFSHGMTPAEETKFGSRRFGNRGVAGGYPAEGYGHRNVAKMLWSPTNLVAALALKHLGIDVTDEFGHGYDADKRRHEMLADDNSALRDRDANHLLQGLVSAFHYKGGSNYLGGLHYHDRNWNHANGIFKWGAAQTQVDGVDDVTDVAKFKRSSATSTSATSFVGDTEVEDFTGPDQIAAGEFHGGKNTDHGRNGNNPAEGALTEGGYGEDGVGGLGTDWTTSSAIDGTSNAVLPWNAGLKGHGTVAHEEELRRTIVNVLDQRKELSDWFSGLMQDPADLDAQVAQVQKDWSMFDRVVSEGITTVGGEDKAARYAATADFAFAGVNADADRNNRDDDDYGGDIGRVRAGSAGWDTTVNVVGGDAYDNGGFRVNQDGGKNQIYAQTQTVPSGESNGMIEGYARIQNLGQVGKSGGQRNTYMGNIDEERTANGGEELVSLEAVMGALKSIVKETNQKRTENALVEGRNTEHKAVRTDGSDAGTVGRDGRAAYTNGADQISNADGGAARGVYQESNAPDGVPLSRRII